MSQPDAIPERLSVLAQLPGTDIPTAYNRFRGNDQVFYDLLALFQKKHGDDAAKIRAAFDRDDPVAARMVVHSLKSSAAVIGAVALSAAAARLEHALHQGQHDACPPLTEQLFAQLEVITTALARWSSTP